jgi:hypothetical protein
MSTFEPAVIISILKNSTLVPLKEKKDFEKKWKEVVGHLCLISETA